MDRREEWGVSVVRRGSGSDVGSAQMSFDLDEGLPAPPTPALRESDAIQGLEDIWPAQSMSGSLDGPAVAGIQDDTDEETRSSSETEQAATGETANAEARTAAIRLSLTPAGTQELLGVLDGMQSGRVSVGNAGGSDIGWIDISIVAVDTSELAKALNAQLTAYESRILAARQNGSDPGEELRHRAAIWEIKHTLSLDPWIGWWSRC